MRKATLLTLALSVSALFASAQSLKTFTAGKVYSIKNKKQTDSNGKFYYAAAMPQTSNMACTAEDKLDLSCLFTITPVGETGTYTIKPYADDTKVVYAIEVANKNNTVGIKENDNAENTKWKIAEVTGATNYVSIISASATAEQTDAYWNARGSNADWDLRGIGGYQEASTNGGSLWTIAEVTNEQVTAAIAAYKDAYRINEYAKFNTITDEQKSQIGYASNLNDFIEKAKTGTKEGATNLEVYNAAIKPNEVNWNLPVDGKVYKIYGLYKNGDKIYAGTKSGDEPKYYVAQKTSGTNVYRFVSTTADAEALSYDNRNDFTVGVTNTINLGALTLTYAKRTDIIAVAAASNGTLNHFSNSGKNDYENKGVKYSNQMYFEEVSSTDYAGHAVAFTESTDGKAYATLNLPFATTIPAGVTAYKKGESTESSVKLEVYKNETDVLPANTPVLLQADAAETKTFAPTEYKAKEETGFSGTLAATAVTAANAYILAKDGDAVKFCKLSATSNTVNENKAYLTLNTAAANALNFDFGGVTTGIENAVADKANNAPIYDLSGRRVMNAVKGGIYIQNGKKFVK